MNSIRALVSLVAPRSNTFFWGNKHKTKMLKELINELRSTQTRLVAVSKNKSETEIMDLYRQGQRHFGENRVQEMCLKQEHLPNDIMWHQIGHLQSNKVKYIAPFVHMIHSVDSARLLHEIDHQAKKSNRKINVLIQIKIAAEDSKFGFSYDEVANLFKTTPYHSFENVSFCGLMGMATFTDNHDQIRSEFRYLKNCLNNLTSEFFWDNPQFKELSMGMSDDYQIAVEEGSTIVRIGTLLFGARTYQSLCMQPH